MLVVDYISIVALFLFGLLLMIFDGLSPLNVLFITSSFGAYAFRNILCTWSRENSLDNPYGRKSILVIGIGFSVLLTCYAFLEGALHDQILVYLICSIILDSAALLVGFATKRH